MQSLASLMSFKQSDVGNLEDFYDSDEEPGQQRRSSPGHGHAPPATGSTHPPSLTRANWLLPVYSLETAWNQFETSQEPAWYQPGVPGVEQTFGRLSQLIPVFLSSFPVCLPWVKPTLPLS